MNTAPFLILETGDPVAPLRRHGGFGHWIRIAAGLGGGEFVARRVHAGAELPDHRGWAGVLLSGSGAMVTDRADWSERTADWLRTAHQRGLPMLGICYGHQLIAHALGGRVDWHPQGREMGTVEVQLHDAARADPLFTGMPERFPAQTSHMQSVLEPPPGAVLLARSAHDGCKAFRLGERSWGLQFHPEFSASHMRGYIDARRQALRDEGRDPYAMQQAVRPAPQARRVLRRFVAWSRRHA